MRIGVMRRMAAAAGAAALAAGLTACAGGGSKTPEEKSLYEQGMEVIQIMAEMAGSEAYAGMVSGSGEIQARMGEIGGGTGLPDHAGSGQF